MRFAFNIIKIKYSDEGYLPNYPHHLISDEEMFDAFINNDISYFYDKYPLMTDKLKDEYDTLIKALKYHINTYLNQDEGSKNDLPDWVYSYMLGAVVSVDSSVEDRHYLLSSMGVDNIEDLITEEAQLSCYQVSKRYVNKLTKNQKQIEINGEVFLTRPPTMFGEPHVIKELRLQEVNI